MRHAARSESHADKLARVRAELNRIETARIAGELEHAHAEELAAPLLERERRLEHRCAQLERGA